MNITTLTLNKKGITDFAKERNLLMKKAKTEWVLFLDHDEQLNKPIDTKKLNGYFKGFYINRKNYFLSHFVGQDKLLRLGKKSAGKWKRLVHETWEINKVHIGSVLRDTFIIHNTANNLSDYLKKINYYSDLHALANKKEGKKSNLFKIMFFPIAKFIITLVKSKNVVFSIMQSLHSFLSWTKLLLYYS